MINTENVMDISHILYKCRTLKKIIHNFNTNKVSRSKFMFFKCETLEEIDLSKFNIPKRTRMEYVFKM